MGEALVELLERGGQEDLTAHWMAHYLAELMERSKTATEPERRQAQQEATALIMDLWRHRTYLPGRYPLASFEPVLHSLARLSDTAPWHQFSPRPPPDDGTNDPVHKWLARAEAINDASRTAIRSCLNQAIVAAAKNEEKWLDQLKDLTPLEDEVLPIILRLVDFQKDDKDEKNAVERRALAALDLLRQEILYSVELREDDLHLEYPRSLSCQSKE